MQIILTTKEELRSIISEAIATPHQSFANPKDGLVTEKEAGELLKVSRQTLLAWRKSGKMPFEIYGNGRIVRYKITDLLKLSKEV